MSTSPAADQTTWAPRATALLTRWAEAMEVWWQKDSDLWGFGGDQWGVQAAWRHCTSCAVLAAQGGPRAAHWQRRAVTGLRTLLRTHASGTAVLPSGKSWGCTWISALALERAWHGIALLEPVLSVSERTALDTLLIREAEWLCNGYQRGGKSDISCTRWNHEGRSNGESNLWNGALLWRAAARFPEHSDAAAWRARAHAFLLNGISIAADTRSERIIAGKPLREWVTSAGFFDHFCFDHHGYLNVGYQVICLSQAALLHFDARADGFATPESLHHHQADLWKVVRRMIFGDGRLARIGGDTRVRYAYCQEYLVPAAMYAADHLGDGDALKCIDGWLATAEQEAATNDDGTFYSRRLAYLAEHSPSYWLRLEGDRACALSLLLCYQPLVRSAPTSTDPETRLTGTWAEPEHGAAVHRSPTRFASFAWRAHGLAQGMCQPPDDGNLAEWSGNLVGQVVFADLKPEQEGRKLIAHDQTVFPGGFVTWGRLAVGCGCHLDESWQAPATGQAVHHIAYAALPDDHSVLAIEVVRIGAQPAIVRARAGLHLNLPNDLFNENERIINCAGGHLTLRSGENDGVVALHSRWAQLAPHVGVIGLSGGDTIAINRSRQRRGGSYRSLHVEEILWGHQSGTFQAAAGSDVLDVAWLVRSGTDAADTARCAADNTDVLLTTQPEVRVVAVTVGRQQRFLLALNLSEQAQSVSLPGNVSVCGGPGILHADSLTLPGYAATLMKECLP